MAEQDRRVRRTRRAISEAFVTLVLERGYDRVTVQDILDRADVGRSTFYAHYRDKEALLVSAFEDLREDLRQALAMAAPLGLPADEAERSRWSGDPTPQPASAQASGPVSPAGVIFDHAYRRRVVYRALCGRQGGDLVYRHLRQLIGDLLREHLRPQLTTAGSNLSVEVVAEFYTGAVLGLLTWWVAQGFRPGPARLGEMYQRLVVLGLPAAVTAGETPLRG